MRLRTWVATSVCVCVTLGACLTAAAQIPRKLNYQVMLTDDLDQPLADEAVQLVFTIYDDELTGTALWTETQNVTTNGIGVVTVLLGDVTPMDYVLSGPIWLEVEVDGATLSPRREIATVPFASWSATASDATMLGGAEAQEYVLADDLDGPGTVNNPSNPVDWNMLFDVPAGFADGVDDTGSGGDGHSLDADDGSPVDALYVDSDGNVGIGAQGEDRALYVGGTSPTDAVVSLEEEQHAGAVSVRTQAGALVAKLSSDTSDTGGGTLWLARDGIWGGFYARGNWQGSGEPRVGIGGTVRSVTFDMSYEGTNCVDLPVDAIDAGETRDEPGVGSIQAANDLDLTYQNVTTVASRTIDVPTNGYVFVMGTAEVRMYAGGGGGACTAKFGASMSVNAWSDAAQEMTIALPGTMPEAWYYTQATAQGLFQVNAGSNTFHMNAQELYGEVWVGSRQLTVMFFPTAYGSVDTTD